MTDDALRATERALVSAPADLELRRRHARLLHRAGQAERALSALDLAWRLGADELWDELRAGLDARTVRVADLELRYVPAGPFVMGSDDHDDDAKPEHLVELSAFHVAARPLAYDSLRGTPEWRSWMGGRPTCINCWQFEEVKTTVAAVGRRVTAEGVAGRLAVITEAQWERVVRAGLLRPDGASPYGVERDAVLWGPGDLLEWTADGYAPDVYESSPRRDPVATRPATLRVVRGVSLPLRHGVVFREAVDPEGRFHFDEGPPAAGSARAEEGLGIRVVLVRRDDA